MDKGYRDRVLRELSAFLGETVTLEKWSPGDGWSRYKLADGTGGDLTQTMRKRELDAVVFALGSVLYRRSLRDRGLTDEA